MQCNTTGSLVIQIAKLKGCATIGFAGSQAKLDYLKSVGVDFVLNYKDYATGEEVRAALRSTIDAGVAAGTIAARGDGDSDEPRGIDVYFDNTGGPVTDAVMALHALRARLVM
jgi:NADPH-dependent curcumin reductase CurA